MANSTLRDCAPFVAAVAVITATGCGRAAVEPAPPNTAVTPATHSFFPIVSGVHAVSCDSCHGGLESFRQFNCLGCHGHEQMLTGELHRGLTSVSGALPDGGTGYAYSSASCLSCHATGARVAFDHAGVTSSCATCHDSGAPFDPLPVAGSGLDGGSFVHPDKGGNDCRACHTIVSWAAAWGGPDGVRDPKRDAIVAAQVPAYAGTSIVSVTPQPEALPMPMVHSSRAVPSSLSCVACHAGVNNGTFYPGQFHASLAAAALAQPSACLDCHATSVPTGFVGPSAPSRTPASGEMKHDAVLWSDSARTNTAAVTGDCAACHQPPPASATWATPRKFHASIAAQPPSCLDCHANSRPVLLLTAANAAVPLNVTFDHTDPAAMADCTACHLNGAPTQYTSWAGGRFHVAPASAPATCLPCHSGERPSPAVSPPSTWVSATYPASPFDYVTNAAGTTHGAGQDCVLCHAASAGTGSWTGGSFTHGAGTLSSTTCIACHSTQRPDLNGYGPSQITYNGQPFDHAQNGTGDCLGCHATTRYARYAPIPGGDWSGGVAYPGSTLISSASRFITLDEIHLTRSGANNLVTGSTTISATYSNAMLHDDPVAMPAQVYPGPAATPDNGKCWHCHTNDGALPVPHVTSYANGQFHASLTSYQAVPGGAITDLGQPAGHCNDCHAGTRPAGIVEKSASDLQPMDHLATFTSGSVAAMDCASCHRHPGTTCAAGHSCWEDGAFHVNIGSAAPQDCTACHYPLMADSAVADVTSGAQYQMSHRSGQLTFQNCATCHTAALQRSTSAPLAAALFSPGNFHSSVPAQPAACNECHLAVSRPAGLTQSAVSYPLAAGATSTNQRQWMSHASPAVIARDCAVCHAGDAAPGVAAWSRNDSFHAAVPAPATCTECHGLGNGGGSTAGTNNNMPSGLTSSSMQSSAASDPSTGVPAGTLDQITHADINATSHDCNFCHTQAGATWAQASFHVSFSGANPLILNRTTGRCSNCHMNVKPTAAFTAFDHSALTAAAGTQDCNSCHSWPGTGTPSLPNWLGATAAPSVVTLTGFTGTATDITYTGNSVSFPHPSPGTYTSCAQCHLTSDFTQIVDYNHDGLTTNVSINGVPVANAPNLGASGYDASTNPTFCVYCHDSRSTFISSTGLSSAIAANTTAGSTVVSTASTAALTTGMTVSGTGIPTTTTRTRTFTASTASGSTTVTTASPQTFSAGTPISGPGIPADDTVAVSVSNATSFTLTAPATATGTGVTLTATITVPLTVTIVSIASPTAFVISAAASATGTSLTVTHARISLARIGNHQGSTSGQDCTSCHYVRGIQALTPPTPGVFGSGSIGGN